MDDDHAWGVCDILVVGVYVADRVGYVHRP